MRLALPRRPTPRQRRWLAGLGLLIALALYVGLGYRDAGPDPLPLDATALAEAKELDGPARARALRAIIAEERAVAPAAGFPNEDPRLLAAAQQLAVLAEAGQPAAAYRLGWYYMNGWGVARDRCSAVTWYYAAARQGDANAQFWLALAYLPPNGQGLRPDKLAAYQWASAAVAQDLPIARELFHFFTRDLSPAERAAAQASLASWRPATAPAPVIERFPYVPILVGLWPRQTDDVMPCRQDDTPLEQWPEE